MAIQSQGDSEDVVGEINVTPLVDVMLVLLVVFIVTAPLLANAVHVHLPQTPATSQVEPKKSVNVSVDAQGKVYLDRAETDLASLESQLTAIHRADPDIAVHLNADQAVNYGLVAKAMTAVDKAGVSKLSVLTANASE
jgi:biopolymer transport protein ExbD